MSKYAKKRKGGDEDTSFEGAEERRQRDERGDSPAKSKKKRESSPDTSKEADSLSIEETNKLRAKLGLAPLEVEDKSKPKSDEEDDGSGVKVYNEDGIEIHHKAADNLSDKKREAVMREKLEAQKQKRKIQEKLLKARKIAEEVEDEGADAWVAKMRRADERAKMLDAMDEEFGVTTIMDEEKEKAKRKKARDAAKKRAAAEAAVTAGLLVGHSKSSFFSGKDQILVLEDKGVLEDGDEVLVNPNMTDNERHARNVELKKRKDYKSYEETYDADGNVKKGQMLAKYDGELEGEQKHTFRLDDRGEVDLAREEEEERMRARMQMAGKTLVSLDQDKFKTASDFYTQEEMVSFRKVKKSKGERKTRKKLGKVLKADDLQPIEDSEGRDIGSRRRRRNSNREEDEDMEKTEQEKIDKEDGELDEIADDGEGGAQKKGWKKATKGAVDIDALKRLAALADEEEDSEDELTAPDANLAGIIIDDDATDELSSVLDRARRLKQNNARAELADPEDAARRVVSMMAMHDGGGVKKEEEDEGEKMETDKKDDPDGISIDATMEYCRNIGELTSYGIIGNRRDAIDMSNFSRTEERKREKKEEGVDEFESVQKWKRAQAERERRKMNKKDVGASSSKNSKGGWRDESRVDSGDERDIEDVRKTIKEEDRSESEEDDDGEYQNVLGDESDTRKGVGAMLKMAAQKGYLADPNAKRQHGHSLEHLQNKRVTKLESEKFDMEDKYVKKLERMGTTGSGPCRSFTEKSDYCPEIVLDYVDEKGRTMEPKDAFRTLSWKFHGKKPGKKQIEKRMVRVDKKEMMKKTESWDTPLGTLNKQLKKQEQLQSPYIVLSNNGRQTEIKKE